MLYTQVVSIECFDCVVGVPRSLGWSFEKGTREDAVGPVSRTLKDSSSGICAATDPLTSVTVTSSVVTCARARTSRGRRSRTKRRTVVVFNGDASLTGDDAPGERRARVALRGDAARNVAPDVASVAANIAGVSCGCEWGVRTLAPTSTHVNVAFTCVPA